MRTTTTVADNKRRRRLGTERGLATVESIPLLVVFVMLMGYALGMFGMIHTSILHSIAARTYAFETFRNRTNLAYFRENTNASGDNFLHYRNLEIRLHAINSERADQRTTEFVATTRPLAMGWANPPAEAKDTDHATKIFSIEKRNQSLGVSPGWVMVGYGMCLNARCGDR